MSYIILNKGIRAGCLYLIFLRRVKNINSNVLNFFFIFPLVENLIRTNLPLFPY